MKGAVTLGREALATLREATLVPLDLAPVLPEASAGDDVVVLLHGFFATAGVFRPLRRRLESELGARVASFTHLPGVGVKRIALALARMVDRLPSGARVHLVGHSLGGLVARWYVEELGGHHRVTQTIALAAPFGGAAAATRFPWFVGGDLHPKSELIEKLRACEARTCVPHCSIIGDADRLVYPPEEQAFSHGDHIVLDGVGHAGILFDGRAMGIVVERIRRTRVDESASEMPADDDDEASAA